MCLFDWVCTIGFRMQALYPGGSLYLPVNVGLICFFNYFYTFLQLDPKVHIASMFLLPLYLSRNQPAVWFTSVLLNGA